MTTRLKAARLTNDTLVSKIDDSVGELEAAVAEVLGYATDEDITESAFLIDNSGRLTKPLVRQEAAIPTLVPGAAPPVVGFTVGAQVEDSSTSAQGRLGLFWVKNGDDYEPAVGIAPTGIPDADEAGGTRALGILLSDGGLVGKNFSNGVKGLLPVGSGNANDYYNAVGGQSQPSHVQNDVFVLTGPTSLNIPSNVFYHSSNENVVWTTETYDPLNMHTVNPSNGHKATIANTGNYLFSASVTVSPSISPTGGYLQLIIYVHQGGAEKPVGKTLKKFVNRKQGAQTESDFSVECSAAFACVAADYAYVEVTWQDIALNASLFIPYAVTRGQFSGVRIP